MIRFSKKTTCAIAIFTAMATTMMFTGCSETTDETTADQAAQSQETSTTLQDGNGQSYTLSDNGDGTETATYANGDAVTFQRDENGDLTALSGNGSLLATLAASYFLYHHLLTPQGSYYDAPSHRYVSNGKPLPEDDQQQRGGGYYPIYGGSSTYRGGNSGGSSAASKASIVAPAGAKTGFGSAGARGGAS